MLDRCRVSISPPGALAANAVRSTLVESPCVVRAVARGGVRLQKCLISQNLGRGLQGRVVRLP